MIIKSSSLYSAKQANLIDARGHEDSQWFTKNILNYIDWRVNRLIRLRDWFKTQIDEDFDFFVDIVNTHKMDGMIKVKREKGEFYSLYDDLMIFILNLVYSKIRYVPDDKQFGTPEYWQTARQTWINKKGDCEDGSILICTLARMCGVPSYRIRIVCGDVEGGGHCWVRYVPDNYPLNPVFIDWCYWVDLSDINYRKFYYDRDGVILEETLNNQKLQKSNYIRYWWGFNDENEYGKFKSVTSHDAR